MKFSSLFLSFVVFFSASIAKADWNAVDSPAFMSSDMPKADVERIRQAGDIMQFMPLVAAVGIIAYYQDTQIHKKIMNIKELSNYNLLTGDGWKRSATDFYEWYKDDGLLQLAGTVGSSLAVMSVTKLIVGRPRPLSGVTWNPGNGSSSSFFSGHTVMAFAPTGFVHKRYGIWHALPLYAMASFVGFSRVAAQAHYITDVLVGAGVGVGMGFLFSWEKKPENLDITPVVSPAFTGLNINYRW
jgi:membrane-associated phospholipid phosphatase